MSGEYILRCIYSLCSNAGIVLLLIVTNLCLYDCSLNLFWGKKQIGQFQFSWKKTQNPQKQEKEPECKTFGSFTNLFCNTVDDHLHGFFVFLFVLSVLHNWSKHKFAPALHEFTVKFNCICQFIQIPVCTVITIKGVDIKGSDRKVRAYMKNVNV